MLVRHSAFDNADGRIICARTVVNVMAYLTTLTLLLRSGRVHWLLAGILTGMLISVGLAFADLNLPQMVTSSVRMGNGRWQGLMPGANRFANLCAITFTTSVGLLAIRQLRAFRLLLAAVAGAGLLGLAMSGSRGATLTTGLSIVCLLWLTGLIRGRLFFSQRILVFSALAFAVGLVLFSFYKEIIPHRLVVLIEAPEVAWAEMEDDVRRDLFEIAFDIFRESPFIGAGGSAAMFTIFSQGDVIDISSHNMYLKVLSTSGAVGLTGYLALPAFLLLRLGSAVLPAARRRMDEGSHIPLALTWLVLILSHGVVISIDQTTHVWLLFAAAAYVCIRQAEWAGRGRPSSHQTRLAIGLVSAARPCPPTAWRAIR
jgi:O-antigen ligase